MTGFADALRAVGVAADRARLTTSLMVLSELDPGNADQLYWGSRLALCSEPDDLPKFDAIFDLWFRGARTARPGTPPPPQRRTQQLHAVGGANSTRANAGEDEVLRTAASEAEVLRRRDVGGLSAAERDEVNRLIALLAPRVGRRRTLRRRPGGRGRIDIGRTVRHMLRQGGEPGSLSYSRPREKPRRLVLLLDVSGSMAPYADALLRFAHAAVRAAPATTEVFTIGTRLTRVTRQLRLRDADQALRAAGNAIPDWSGGTRLGESMRAFLDLWGQRGTARRAVVILASDGWERGDASLLGEQMSRLARLAHSVVWVNPHRGKDGFAPATAGMVAALPYLDELIAGHSLQALHDLAEVISHA